MNVMERKISEKVVLGMPSVCVYVHLTTIWMVGWIFIHIQDLRVYPSTSRSSSHEYEHSSSKSRVPPKHKIMVFSKMATVIK
jgi:hypothetical protein